MKNNFIILEEANLEIGEAFLWYENTQIGLGEKFLTTLESCFNSIISNPKIYAKKFKRYRQAVVKGFPYVVVYEVEKRKIVVYAVFHTSRKPKSRD